MVEKTYLDDNDITSLPMYKRARLGLGYLPQQPSIFRGLSLRIIFFNTTQKNSDQIKKSFRGAYRIFTHSSSSRNAI